MEHETRITPIVNHTIYISETFDYFLEMYLRM
jgi:hypothetical protein